MTRPDHGLRALLDALRTKATDDDLADEGHHFRFGVGYPDLTKCNHGDCGYFCNRGDGPLIAALWNALRNDQLITLSDHEAAVKAAVDRVVTVDQLKAISLALSKITGRDGADEAALDCLASEVRSIRARANGGE